MSWEYTYNDKLLCDSVIFRIPYNMRGMNGNSSRPPGVNADLINQPDSSSGGGLGYFDSNVETRKQVGLLKVGFQFPPKIISDSTKGEWEEPNTQQSAQPVAGFKFVGPRTISMSWTYVVDCFDENKSNTSWTVSRISHYVRSVRGYFMQGKRVDNDHNPLVCYLRFWAIGGAKQMSGRLSSVDVKYGDTLVVPNNNPGLAFPLRTDMSVDIKLWGTGKLDSLDHNLTDIEGLMNAPPDWY